MKYKHDIDWFTVAALAVIVCLGAYAILYNMGVVQ